MLIVGRSSGRPSRLLRRVSVTNSSISLPVWSEEPMKTLPAPAAASSVPARPAVVQLWWVEERRQQRQRVVALLARGRVDVRARDVVVEHGVPEPVDRVRELGLDGRVDVRGVHVERPDRRLHLACELLEDQVLVLHLGDEPRSLEEPLTVAVAAGPVLTADADRLPVGEARRRARRGVRPQDVVDVVDQPVVLGVEDLVDRGQRDVLVASTVTAGGVRVRAARRRRCPRAAW